MPPPPYSIQFTYCHILESLPLTKRTGHYLIKGTTVQDLCYKVSTTHGPLAKVGIYSITMSLNAEYHRVCTLRQEVPVSSPLPYITCIINPLFLLQEMTCFSHLTTQINKTYEQPSCELGQMWEKAIMA